MSPMLDIQRRHASVFAIRLGDKGPNGFPQKLTDAIRITSPNEAVCAAFVDVYGGTVRPWNDGGRNEFEAYLPTTSLSILVLPGQSLQQWWESYKKSVCVRRCDGVKDHKSGKPCQCPADLDDRMADKHACKPMTRVNVLCPDVAVIGSGALVSHGLIAAETLPQSIAVAEAALSRGLMVPARLRVTEHKGLTHYIVPQIEIVGISLVDLMGEPGNELPTVTNLPELPVSSVPSWRPVGELPAAPVMTVSEQMAELDTPKPKRARANAAEPLPPTGLAPRTAAEADAGAEAVQVVPVSVAKTELLEAVGGDKALASTIWTDTFGDATRVPRADLDVLLAELPADDVDHMTAAQNRKLHALASERWPGLDGDEQGAAIRDLASTLHTAPVTSRKDIGRDLAARMIDQLETEMQGAGT